MIHAYDRLYLEAARRNLARMLDFAVYELKYDLQEFFDMFLHSDICRRFENGESTILAGRSGVELVYDVLMEVAGEEVRIEVTYAGNRSREYWLGWALAYYQWYTSLRFEEIIARVPLLDILHMYSPYHEMDIQQFVDAMNELYWDAKKDTNLKLLRQKSGLSQSELAESTQIPVRTIQQYEQRQKNINKAQAEYLIRLSRCLCCEVEELIEKVGSPAE